MTKVIFMSAALIAAAVITTQAQAARNSNAAARHTMNKTHTMTDHTMTDCVRAPNVGAFATAPYTKPPCMPNSMN
ncbi:conserved exported hypothetical protein [Bradyrhizobium oligotrophicum S58]|uniref:Uncharacterized protein n=1 Tax=Bradyrhizobium oligotrophicum S58 TaxID=1245469 RepID=M4Z403_9BRAD|nr:hypothetical protein [Bradyrhizobium oligotrophicum]BAM88103.1 conserved exported hypothetical protein [Bradyrhizobium oligotrophicum S58]